MHRKLLNPSRVTGGSDGSTDIAPEKIMKVTEIIKAGNQAYTHHYMRTMTGEEMCQHTLSAPKHLLTLAKSTPNAEVVIFGDDTIGIEIEGKIWAAELPNAEFRPAKSLPREVWQYCNLAMGRSGDTNSR